MERFRFDYDFYWRTGDGETFEYQSDSNTLQPSPLFTKSQSRLSLARVLFSFCFLNFKSQKIFVVSYPYFPRSLLLAICLFLLKPFRVTVVVDVQDLPLPRETPWTAGYLIWWLVNELYYLHAFFIVNSTECAKLYGRRAAGRTFIIPMAAHHKVITPKPSSFMRTGLTLGYVGTIDRRRGFPELIHLVKKLRAEGLDIYLIINGNNSEEIDLGTYPWVRLYERQPLECFSELLQNVDIGVIPYVDQKYWGLMSITKMATYMAAGLPILSLHLAETANILAKWDCGVSVKNWDDMASAIKMFCQDKSLRERMGKNARKAAVEEYNWEKQAQRLGEFVGNLRN